jgi:hypothetical protein
VVYEFRTLLREFGLPIERVTMSGLRRTASLGIQSFPALKH